jgi:myo-inositol-1(or 4)-monophosphatase
MTPAELATRFAAVQEWTDEAAALAQSYFGDAAAMRAEFKGHHDMLTAADLAVEKLLRHRIETAFPGDGVLGEEGGGGAAERLWIIDPIDGTANFARGIPHWCISIGFMAAGVPELGVLAAPALGETWLGRRGYGATRNGGTLAVRDTADPKQASVEIGWSWRLDTSRYLACVARAFAAGCVVRRGGSGALGMAYVADGRTDAYAELHINAWDVAAAVVIAAEAGAYVSPFFAGTGLVSGNSIVCCAPGLRPTMEAVMREAR